MTSRPERSEATPERPPPEDDPAGGLEALRALLLAPEREHLEALRARVEDAVVDARTVAGVLPEAVTRRSAEDGRLAEALFPTVEEALATSVRRNPETIVSAIFPIIGPAIRRAIASALREAIQSLNRALENSFSVRGLLWRVEAWRTGRPFAEVVLLHSLVYRVEQVFLIHGESGLLVQHLVAPDVAAPDPELVSAMLTAIQDFARDSFESDRASDAVRLDAVQLGDLAIWIERGAHGTVAGVIRGTAPPEELRQVFRDAVAAVHMHFGQALRDFAGDTAALDPARPILEECLQGRYETSDGAPSPLLIGLAAALGLALVVWGGLAWAAARRWDAYVERLRVTPGLVVTAAERRGGSYVVTGLRDPLAADPVAIAREAGVGPVVGRWEPYYSFAPDLVLARARALLAPPETVTVAYEPPVLRLAGVAPAAWIASAASLARALPGVERVDLSGLAPAEESELRDHAARAERAVVLFAKASSRIEPAAAPVVAELAREVAAALRAAAAADVDARFEVVGRADAEGDDSLNDPLSAKRAASVAAALAAAGVDPSRLVTRGAGTREPVNPDAAADDSINRSVSVRLVRAPAGGAR